MHQRTPLATRRRDPRAAKKRSFAAGPAFQSACGSRFSFEKNYIYILLVSKENAQRPKVLMVNDTVKSRLSMQL
jgi:hypothetical protein